MRFEDVLCAVRRKLRRAPHLANTLQGKHMYMLSGELVGLWTSTRGASEPEETGRACRRAPCEGLRSDRRRGCECRPQDAPLSRSFSEDGIPQTTSSETAKAGACLSVVGGGYSTADQKNE